MVQKEDPKQTIGGYFKAFAPHSFLFGYFKIFKYVS
jgi:hypothetical protein